MVEHEALRARVAELQLEVAALREAEKALIEERNHSRMLVEGANALVVGLDAEGRVTIFNRAAEEITGYRREDLHGRDWFEVLVPRDRYPEVWKEFLELRGTGIPDDFENPILTATGEERIIAWRNSILRAGDTVMGTLSFGLDITERRRAEGALRESEARNRAILQTASVGIVIVDADGRIVQVNARAEELFGFRREELLGQTVEVLLPEPLRAAHVAHRAAYLADPRVRQMGPGRDLVARRKDGGLFPVEIGLSFADTDAGRLIIAFISDITERKRAERRLRAQFAVTQVLAEGLPLADVTPRLLGALCECLGWEFGELWRVDFGAHVLRWEGCWHSPALECAAFTALSRELTFAPGVGIPGRVWISGQPVWIPEITREACFLRAAVAHQVGLHAAYAFPIRSRDRVAAVAGFFSREILQPDADLLDLVGDVASRIGLYIEYRRAQEDSERQREILHQQEKLAALGTLAAGLAHEINNPMAIIASRVECMLMEAVEQGLSETARGDLQVIGKHADRVARITQGLLSLSRHQVWQFSPVDLNSIVEEALLLMEKQLARERVALERDLAPGLPAVLGSASHLQQVFLNLLTNAREAMPEGGRLRVATRRSGEAVEVEVADTGKGIPAEHLSKVFDPFFTTKEKGTGLGLAISYGIVRDHGGTLTVRSREGEGSTFLVSLRVAGKR